MLISFRIILILIIILIIYFIIKGSGNIKRVKQRTASSINLLKPRRIGIVKQYSIQNPGSLISVIINCFNDYHPLVASSDHEEALIYIPDQTELKKMPIAAIPDMKLPVRIILKVTDKVLYVQIDEDYRSVIKGKYAGKLIKAKYKNTFHYYLRKVESCIDQTEL